MKRHFTLILSMALAVFGGLMEFSARADDAAKSAEISLYAAASLRDVV